MSPGSRLGSRWTLWGLAALLLFSFALRLWAASSGLDSSRTFDERYSLRNVAGILQKGELRPSNTFYLGLSYYPQTALLAASQGLHRLTGWPVLAVFPASGKGFTPTAYFLCRLLSAAYGTLSLLVVFVIGRRLASPQLGLLAATLLAAFLRHLRSSAHFKPDILVVLLTAVALFWTLAAVARPGLGRFLRVGFGVGLATASKYTGIAAALPLTIGVLLYGWRDRRQWLWLVAAGLTAIAVFVALNPYLGVVFQFIPKQLEAYAGNAVEEDSDHGVVLWRQLEFLTEQPAWWVAPFLFLGIVWLSARALRPADGVAQETRRGWTVVLALLLGHTALHAGSMNLFRAQNYLPVAPAAALISAWAMIEAWRWLGRRASVPARSGWNYAFWSVVVAALLVRQFAHAYESVVPPTWQYVQETVLAAPPPAEGSHWVFEKELGNFLAYDAPSTLLVDRVERLSRLEVAALDRADLEAFPAARLAQADAAFYRSRISRLPPALVETIEPRLFRRRGEAVVLLRHPWQEAGAALPLAAEPPGSGLHYGAKLTQASSGETFSLVVAVPRRAPRGHRWTASCPADGGPLPLEAIDASGRRQVLASPRFVLEGGVVRCRLQGPSPEVTAELGVELRRWRLAAAATVTSSPAPSP
jgi:4-amino-4-deoxy-L-arabinose transferase-like glycosyltransferase